MTESPAACIVTDDLDDLDALEAESIFILREVAAQFARPVMLFSGGKDSIVMSRLAEKAFRPGRFPFPLMLIDTGHNFPETLAYIEHRIKQLGESLIVKHVQETIDQGKARDPQGPYASRNRIQSITLMDAIRDERFDAVIGGARRDEEKARAKERIFSIRDDFGQWQPKNQRPELWNLYNGRIDSSEHVRVFPLSNWTELDIWQYIERERLDVPSIYFSHDRTCVRRSGLLLPHSPFLTLLPEEEPVKLRVRVRTVGDMTCTAAMPSEATSVSEVVAEIQQCRQSERGLRMDDKTSDSAMEERKLEGYF